MGTYVMIQNVAGLTMIVDARSLKNQMTCGLILDLTMTKDTMCDRCRGFDLVKRYQPHPGNSIICEICHKEPTMFYEKHFLCKYHWDMVWDRRIAFTEDFIEKMRQNWQHFAQKNNDEER